MSDNDNFSRITRQWMDVFMQRSMHGWNHYAKSTGLSMPQINILMQLYHKGPCGMSQISERFNITAAAASQLVDKLVQAGYLNRAEDPGDRRAKMLTLSPAGLELIKTGFEERYRWLEELATRLTLQEQEKIGEALVLLVNAAREADK